MGVGGVSGELRDYLEYVDVILCLYFNVINGWFLNLLFVLFWLSGVLSSSFLFLEDVVEEMVCFSCSFNFMFFKRKVIV